MANNLLTNDIILKTALMELQNNFILAKVARRDYQDKFDATTGTSIRIRKPTRYVKRVGENIAVQDINQQYTNITVGDMQGVDVQVSSTQWALQLDDFNREVINPAMVTLANAIDSLLYDTTYDFFNYAGTAGTAPNSFATVRSAASLLGRFGIPKGKDLFAFFSEDDGGVLQSALYNTFNEKFNKEIILDGSMGNLAGFDCYTVQNAIRPSRGSASLGTPAINGASQSGSSLILDGFTASVSLKKGALFTIAGVNSVNPTSRNDTGQLKQFVVTEDVQADGSGNIAALKISPAIVLTGPYQNVTALPADNALLTFQATHTKNIFFHREAFALVTIKLPEIGNTSGAYQKNIVDTKSKISLRMTRQYRIENDKEVIRFDVLPAVKCFPDYGGILMGS